MSSPIIENFSSESDWKSIKINNFNFEFKSVFLSPSSEIISLMESVSLKRSISVENEYLEENNKDKTNYFPERLPTTNPDYFNLEYLKNNPKNNIIVNNIKNIGMDKITNEVSNQLNPNMKNDCKEDHCIMDILKGIVAYVEVRSGHENRSKAVEVQLLQMGAKVFPRFVNSVTHVVFKEGRKSTRDRAIAKGIHLVSVLWVESCRQYKCHVPETEYPANIPKIFDSPLFCRKIRKLKSMQPKDFNTEFAGSLEKLQKIFSRIRKDNEHFKSDGSFIENEMNNSTNARENIVNEIMNHDKESLRCRLFYSLPKEIKNQSCDRKNNNNEFIKESKQDEHQHKITTKRRRKLFSELNGPPKLIVNTPNELEKCDDVFLLPEKVDDIQTSSSQFNKLTKNDKLEEHQFSKIATYSRYSLDDFMIKKHKRKLYIKEKPVMCKSVSSQNISDLNEFDDSLCRTIVLTSFQPKDQEIIISIVKSLGGFRIIPCVNETTTHVICADNRRTLNVLFGIARGCWLLSSEWIFKSMELGRWIDEESYELNEMFPAIQINRLEHANKMSDYQNNLFENLGNIFVSTYCVPAYNKLTELITLTGGKIVTSFLKCQIVIGPIKQINKNGNKNILHLKEKWILDCISQHKILPYIEYKYE